MKSAASGTKVATLAVAIALVTVFTMVVLYHRFSTTGSSYRSLSIHHRPIPMPRLSLKALP